MSPLSWKDTPGSDEWDRVITPLSGTKTDGFLMLSSSERVTETEDIENFREVLRVELRVDRLEMTDDDESFLLICEVRLLAGDRQAASLP